MLQKLLIALCTIFVLSACGGDIDLGPDRVADPAPEPEPEPEEPNPEPGDPDTSQIWYYEPFDAAGEDEADPAEAWMSRCADGCDATTDELSRTEVEGDGALAVSPTWASDEDDLEVHTSIEEIDDMTGGNASAWVHVPEAYVTDGNLRMHLFFVNANGAMARSRAFEASSSGWNKLAIWAMEPGTGLPVEGDDSEEPETDYGSFGWHAANFTMENINTVGVRFSANGKPVDVGGDLHVDNVLITQGSAFAPMLLDLTEGWFTKGAYNIEGDEANDPIYGDGFVALEATNPNQQLVQPVEGPGSYGGAEIVFTLSFDQAYVDSADGFQPFGQVFNDTDEGYADDEEVGGEWGCWTGMGNVTVDEELEVSCVLTDEEMFELGEDQYMLLGVQSQTEGVEGTIRIHKVEVKGVDTGDSGPFEILPNQADVDDGTWDNDNWQDLPGAPDISYNADEGVLDIVPNWHVTDPDDQYAEGERTVMYIAGEEELPDLEGATVAVELYLGEHYVNENTGLGVQIYLQQNGPDDFGGDFAGPFSIDSAEDLGDGWYRFENTFTGVRSDPLDRRVGIKLQGSGLDERPEPGETIKLRRFTIE